ncbi:MAG: gamma-glutamyl-gamma-aminobutyrate hydrolase family protein [Symploca sp. SIO2E9]|nr:gamma-glutamyl-gamma-aminobutyrate hydrolase family protein [Symploca sp. SIO2E9]
MNLQAYPSFNKTVTKPTPPIIGIFSWRQQQTGHFYCPAGYAQAVEYSGGVPILLPLVKQDPTFILEMLDGLIFPGGGDIDPVHYNGSHHPKIYGVDPQRDATELAVAKLALKSRKPILGICRGLEVLMVASGGDLVPHVPEEFGETVAHYIEALKSCEHHVQLQPKSKLAAIMKRQQVKVVSWHHQAVRTVPPGWQIAAQAADGVIEALEHKLHPFAIALQWHPEMSLFEPGNLSIFKAFVTAASMQKVKKAVV